MNRRELPKRPPQSLRSRLAFSFALLAIFAIGISLSVSYFNYRAQNRADLRQRLLDIVSLAALQQNGDQFVSITSPADPAFEQIRIQNLRIRSSDPELAFVYTLRYDSQGLYFVVDAVEPGDPLGSAYGERYVSPGPALETNYTSMNQPIAENTFYTDEYGTFLSAYAPFYTSENKLAGIIGVDISASKIVALERQTLFWYIGIFAISLPLIGLLGWLLGNNLAAPISTLTQAAVRISEGDLDYQHDFKTSSSELMLLGKAFFSMGDQLRTLIGTLEKRITERTQALERRASQLQATAELGAAITRIRDLDELLRQATILISQRFGYYHAGIFLLDAQEEYAVLRAANSEGGQRMLGRGHKLKIGQVGIVGYVTGTGEARIALDVGQDATFFNNPDLPDTHSEMAIPLIVGGKVLGALDVQSDKEAAFTDEDVNTLKVLADQIAIAIENAHLFASTQEALETTRRAYSEGSRTGWQQILRESKTEAGYISSPSGVAPISGNINAEALKTLKTGKPFLTKDNISLHIPIKVREDIIGTIRMDKPQGSGQWTNAEIESANALSEQLGNALESARLYEQIRTRAELELVIGEITSKISSSIQYKTIMQSTVEELGQTLGDVDVTLRLESPDTEKANPLSQRKKPV